MEVFLNMAAKERRLAFTQADLVMQLQAFSVEKDFWVCWILRELFSLPGIGEHLTFKGGTSLSKAWRLIERFSEDIDLIVDKKVLGFGADTAPESSSSGKQRKRLLRELKQACQEWVQQELRPSLEARLQQLLGPSDWHLRVDPDQEDGQCLLFDYPSVFRPDEAGYIRPVVKMELGARSDDWPHERATIRPYVLEAFPALAGEGSVEVTVLKPERTFWEKACLVHEETFRPLAKPRRPRMARHYYDLWCLLRAGIGERALAEIELFERVAIHRELYFPLSWVDYSTLKQGSLRLVPPASHLGDWQKDYRAMLGPMFFGWSPAFEEILEAVREFESTFNAPTLNAPTLSTMQP